MTEYEKMLAGEIYHSGDPEMVALCQQARKLTHIYNHSPDVSESKKRAILEQLLGTIGSNVAIDTPFYTDYGIHTSIGNNVIVGMNCIFIDNNHISIGNNVMIASGVQICTATHPVKANDRILEDWTPDMKRNWYHTFAQKISIGNHVWIGANAAILPGVTIGDHVTIGAGSIVTKDIPDHSLAFGNPCKVIKQLN